MAWRPFPFFRAPAPTAHDSTPLDALPVAVLDLETTGLDTQIDRIVAIAAVAMRGGAPEALAPFEHLVDPGWPIPRAATAIHGIDGATVAGAPRFAGLRGALEAYCANRVVIGHNIGFDVAMLRAETRALGRDWMPPPTLDLVRLAAALEPRERDMTLEGTAARWGVAVRGRHTALGDARAAAGLWTAAVARLAAAGVRTFAEARRHERRARAVIAEQRRLGW